MKKVLLLLLCVHTSIPLASQYKPLSAYADILYALIDKYVNTHSTTNSKNVVNFINSDDTKTTFGDAKAAAYTRETLLFATYQKALVQSEPLDVIIEGLHDVIAQEQIKHDAVFYGTFTTMAVTFLMILYQLRSAWVYYKYDNPLLMSMRGLPRTNTYSNTNGPFVMNAHSNTNTGNPTDPLLIQPQQQQYQQQHQ